VPSNLNTLLIAWASSLILVLGGVLLMEATYSPDGADTETTEQTAAATSDTASNTAQAENAADNADDTAPAENSTELSTAPIAAPGQASEPVSNTASVGAIPQGIPVQPVAALLEESRFGPLPKIADDGRRSHDVYAMPHIRDTRKARIAILITELGKRARQTQRAIDQLPETVSLGFSVYGSDLHEWGQKARADGHEVFLGIPMEPANVQQNDPGPLTLLTTQSRRVKETMLRSSLGKFSGYVGVVNYMGSRFTAASESMRPVLDELKRRGLMFVDNRDSKFSRAATMAAGVNMPWAVNNGYIDNELDAEFIAAQLDTLEKRARAQGAALGIGRAYPVTYRTINVWAAGLDARGFELVPVSSIAGQQALPK
jgi:polysaccharide deacetylase 2 family uncharacterized protein YibQ